MKVLGQAPFRWTLFENSPGTYVLSALCGRVVQYGVDILLSADEARAYEETGETTIDALADAVYADPGHYQARALIDFANGNGWRNAIDEWREARR
jgi:hypothetical protein